MALELNTCWLGVTKMRLMTNGLKKIGGLEGYGLEIVERLLPTPLLPEVSYLRTKMAWTHN